MPARTAPAAGSLLERLAGTRILSRFTLGDVIAEQPKRDVVKLCHTDTIGDALEKLATCNILAAPVLVLHNCAVDFQNTASASDRDEDGPSETMIGWADTREILKAFVVTHASKLAAVQGLSGWDAAMEAVAADFVSRKLVNVCGDDGQLMPASGNEDMSLFSAIVDGFLCCGGGSGGGDERTLTPRSGGSPRSPGGSVVHRVALFRGGLISGILSQSDCMAFLLHHPELVGPHLWGASVAELGFLGRRVVCVSPHTPTHAAFSIMFGHDVSGVGIVDEAEELVGNLSASDLRRLQASDFRVLALPVRDYLARCVLPQGAQAPLPAPVRVTPQTALSTLLELLGGASPRIHRIYVTHEKRPVGVITATDVLRVLVQLESGSAAAKQ